MHSRRIDYDDNNIDINSRQLKKECGDNINRKTQGEKARRKSRKERIERRKPGVYRSRT
jgi:hypothetical protein